MAAIKQVILCGFGGQGIVLAGIILGHAAFNDGKWVGGTNSYGAAARGGACMSQVVISDQPIVFPHVIEADILIAMYQSAYNKYIGLIKPEGATIIYDRRFVSPGSFDKGLTYIDVPATETAIKLLNREIVANMVILGSTVKKTGIVTEQALRSAVEGDIPEGLRDLNIRAIEAGFEL